MPRRLLAVLVAASLATGCTIALPIAAGAAEGTPRRGDAKAQRNTENTVTGAAILGLALDVATFALVTTMYANSGD